LCRNTSSERKLSLPLTLGCITAYLENGAAIAIATPLTKKSLVQTEASVTAGKVNFSTPWGRLVSITPVRILGKPSEILQTFA